MSQNPKTPVFAPGPLPAYIANLAIIPEGMATWILTTEAGSAGNYANFKATMLNGYIPLGDIIIVVATDATHVITLLPNGTVHTIL